MTVTTARHPGVSAEQAVPGISGRTSAVRVGCWAIRRLPLVAYMAVYVFTCYVGALALWLCPRFRALYLLFSGAEPPDLTRDELLMFLVLLHAAPTLLWVGFELGLRTAPQRLSLSLRIGNESNAARTVAATFLVGSASCAIW